MAHPSSPLPRCPPTTWYSPPILDFFPTICTPHPHTPQPTVGVVSRPRGARGVWRGWGTCVDGWVGVVGAWVCGHPPPTPPHPTPRPTTAPPPPNPNQPKPTQLNPNPNPYPTPSPPPQPQPHPSQPHPAPPHLNPTTPNQATHPPPNHDMPP